MDFSALFVCFTLLSTHPLIEGCYVGIQSIGTVSPLGDIVRAVNEELVINCSIHQNYSGLANSQNIKWRRNHTVVDDTFVTIIDNRTAQLRISNASTEDSGIYSCFADEDGKQLTICNNLVQVGYPPPSHVNITCLSRNWQNLTCKWDLPFNPVTTKWQFSYRLNKYKPECPQYLPNHSGCFFSSITSPPYRQAATVYYFVLKGENVLGKSKSDYKFQHYEQVLPDPPSSLTILEVNPRALNVRWNPPIGMDQFPPKFCYRLKYSSSRNKTKNVLEMNTTNVVLKGLIPNTEYNVWLTARSAESVRSPWSDDAIAAKKTPGDVPGGTVNITGSAFQQRKAISSRDITLYWQALPDILTNGDNVTYLVDALEDGLQRNLSLNRFGSTSVQLFGLDLEKSYKFRIKAANEKGYAKFFSYLAVGPAIGVPPPPDHVTVIAFHSGVYEVSWKWAVKEGVTNFTIFFCHAHTVRPGVHCYNSNIEWVFVEPTKQSVNLTLSDVANNEFGVAGNIGDLSSGIVWATCIVPFNGVVGKMKSVSAIKVTSREISLTWRLECSERTGIMEGFSVYYCIYDEFNHTCAGNETQREFVDDPNVNEFTLRNLKPFTKYKIMMSAVTRAGEGEQSNPIINVTLEGAPADGPILIEFSTSNTSANIIVRPPRVPNGVIREVQFYVNNVKWNYFTCLGDNVCVLESLIPYTNYTIYAVVCTTHKLCSPHSKNLLLTTEIGIPGPPEVIEARPVNSTHMMVQWEDPVNSNGPILSWIVTIFWRDPISNQVISREETFKEITNNRVVYLSFPVPCPEKIGDEGTDFNVTMRAQTNMIDGLNSKPELVRCPGRGHEAFPLWIQVTLTIFGIFIVGVILYVLICCVHRLKRKVREMQNIKVQLPKGLDCSNVTALSSYEAFKAQLNTSGPHTTRPLLSIGSEPECDPRFSTSSIGELISKVKSSESFPSSYPGVNKSRRNLSGDSGHESVSSSSTNRTHLSIDSGTEMDHSPVPPSPDCVFMEPWKNPSLAKVYEEDRVTYAQMAMPIETVNNEIENKKTPIVDCGYSKIGSSSSLVEPRSYEIQKATESATFPRFSSERRTKNHFKEEDFKPTESNSIIDDYGNYSCVGVGNGVCGYVPLDTLAEIRKNNGEIDVSGGLAQKPEKMIV